MVPSRHQAASAPSSSSSKIRIQPGRRVQGRTSDPALLHPHYNEGPAAASSSSATGAAPSTFVREIYRVQPQDPAKPDMAAIRQVAGVYWGTSLVVDLNGLVPSSFDELLQLLRDLALQARDKRCPIGQLHLTNLALFNSLEPIRTVTTAIRESLGPDEELSLCQQLFLSYQCSPNEGVELESMCLSISVEVILPTGTGLRAVSRLTPEELLDASRIKSEMNTPGPANTTEKNGDASASIAPGKAPSAEVEGGRESWVDAAALVECDNCHKRRFINKATAELVEKFNKFNCSMLENGSCATVDDWPMVIATVSSVADSRQEAEDRAKPVTQKSAKRRRSKSKGETDKEEEPPVETATPAMKRRTSNGGRRQKITIVNATDAVEDTEQVAAKEEELPVIEDATPIVTTNRRAKKSDKSQSRPNRNSRAQEADTQALFLSLITPIVEHAARILLLAQDPPPETSVGDDVLCIPDSCFEEEVAITDLFELLRKSDISGLRYIKFPPSRCRLTVSFNQDHLESFVDMLAKFRNISHLDFGAIGTAAADSKIHSWRSLSRGFSHTGVTHLGLNQERLTPSMLRTIENGLMKTRARGEAFRIAEGIPHDDLDETAEPYYPEAWIAPSVESPAEVKTTS